MFNCCFQLAFIGPGGPEFLVIMLVLLLMFGAKDAPKIFRKINELMNSVRSTADNFKREIMYSDLTNETPVSTDDDCGYDDEERDYSDETFHNLEKDLGEGELGNEAVTEGDEPGVDPDKCPEEDEDARKV
ncbi:twin-arginine translocase TatA/TatE family subunit [Pontiellaceae bacterium B12219]|nr:twin-arginine translocase TatA/TatE family subunit [Pontiellaceae bacterium B12219]